MIPISFNNAANISARFLTLLDDKGIRPLNKGQIEDEFLSLTALLDAWSSGMASSQISNDTLRTAAGIHDFAAKVLAASGLPEFQNFDEHLKLIAEGTFKTSLSQMDAGYPEDASRKLVELYVACLAIHCGTNVDLDHPVSSKGDNPDVMLDFDGTRWAIAIKTVSSQQGQTLYENVKKAAKQINASSADKGLILLNVKDSLNYKLLRKTHFNSVKDATDALKAELERLIVEIERDRPASDWDPIFAGNAKTPVLLMGQTMARVLVAGLGTIPVPIKMILAYSCGKDADKNGIELAESLNHFMQTILKGEPGPPAC